MSYCGGLPREARGSGGAPALNGPASEQFTNAHDRNGVCR